jgi:hypothetical protein
VRRNAGEETPASIFRTYAPYGRSFSTALALALSSTTMRSNCRFTRGAFLRRK